jgi:hypothetical protein
MFWRKGKKKKESPKKIEGDLWQYLVNKQHVPLDVLRTFRLVERDARVGDTPVGLTMFRIFQPGAVKEQGLTIDSYDSLDNYPELILYEGYYEVTNGQIDNIRIEKMPVR